MATMRDVALLAGVSVATVSHVVNDTRWVREETRARVRLAIEETGWQHNTLARSLARGSGTASVGLAVTGISNEYLADLHQAIEENLALHGLTVLMSETRDDSVREHSAVSALLSRQVDGLIVALGPDPQPAVIEVIKRRELPVVLLDRSFDAPRDFVGSENEAPTAELVAHLIGHGHRRIGMISGRAGLPTSIERTAGYAQALAAAGLSLDPALVVDGDSSEIGGAAALGHLLALRDPPTAVVAANNQMTAGVLRRIHQLGLRVPDELALASFDDFRWGDLIDPPLTAVAQHWTEMGARAAQLMVRRIADRSAPIERLRLPTTLMLRRTCGCPARQSAGVQPVPVTAQR